MKRREFSLASVLLPASSLLVLPAWAQTKNGDGYTTLATPVPSDAGEGQLEVVEFFSYGCSHCSNFEPVFAQWRKKLPADVLVTQVHVGFSKSFEPFQKLFYALEAIGALEQVHLKVFEALQKERLRLNRTEVLFPWVAKQGIDREKFEQAYKSFGVASKVRRANELQDIYRVEGTPALGIAGKYYTDGSLARGFERMTQLADELLERERKAVPAAAASAASAPAPAASSEEQ